MAKKKKQQDKESTIVNYYDLKIEEMDELVAALKGETDEAAEEPVTEQLPGATDADAYFEGAPQADAKPKKRRRTAEEDGYNPYKIDKFSRIPAWIKALFIKFWFAGAVCYFIMMGLFISNPLDLCVLGGVVMGVFVDCIVNPVFRMMESDAKEYNNYMMFPFPFKAYWTFLTNIAYYIGVFFCVNYMYMGVNLLFGGAGSDVLVVGIEPLLFGVFAVMADMAFIGIKDLIVHLVKRRKRNKEETQDV